MKAEMKGKYIYIRLLMLAKPRLSASGKNILIATTRGPRPAEFNLENNFRGSLPMYISTQIQKPDVREPKKGCP